MIKAYHYQVEVKNVYDGHGIPKSIEVEEQKARKKDCDSELEKVLQEQAIAKLGRDYKSVKITVEAF